MKPCITAILMMVFMAVANAEDSRGSFNLKNRSVSSVLAVYETLTDKKLVIEPDATNQTRKINLRVVNEPKKEAAKHIESALRRQANVVIIPLDEKSVAVKVRKR